MTQQPGPGAAGDRLQDLQEIAGAALSRLGAEDLLAELLKRAKAIVGADTAAVLLLDHASGHLVAAAASGLEEEVNQGVCIPVGAGFAGRVAAQARPVIIDRVDRAKVVNPILLEKGIRSLVGVPLVAGGTVIGVLHAGSLTPRAFTGADVQVLELAAALAAPMVASLAVAADQAALAVLQQSLLPAALPAIEGAEMAGRYVPGRGMVGGDWYDVFVLPSGQLAVVIGDVAGSGLPAAVIMSRMRSALRAYAMETPDPAEVLARLDRKMAHFEPDAMATIAYAVFSPALDQARISCAGHLPPVLAVPGRPAELSPVPADPVIGYGGDARRQVTAVQLPPGSVLCFYTDGLVERPGELIDDGLARLCQAVTAGPPDAVCSAVMLALAGDEPGHDDIALLILRRQRLGPAPCN